MRYCRALAPLFIMILVLMVAMATPVRADIPDVRQYTLSDSGWIIVNVEFTDWSKCSQIVSEAGGTYALIELIIDGQVYAKSYRGDIFLPPWGPIAWSVPIDAGTHTIEVRAFAVKFDWPYDKQEVIIKEISLPARVNVSQATGTGPMPASAIPPLAGSWYEYWVVPNRILVLYDWDDNTTRVVDLYTATAWIVKGLNINDQYGSHLWNNLVPIEGNDYVIRKDFANLVGYDAWTLTRIDLVTGEVKWILKIPGRSFADVAASPDKSKLACLTTDGEKWYLDIVDAETGHIIGELNITEKYPQYNETLLPVIARVSWIDKGIIVTCDALPGPTILVNPNTLQCITLYRDWCLYLVTKRPDGKGYVALGIDPQLNDVVVWMDENLKIVQTATISIVTMEDAVAWETPHGVVFGDPGQKSIIVPWDQDIAIELPTSYSQLIVPAWNDTSILLADVYSYQDDAGNFHYVIRLRSYTPGKGLATEWEKEWDTAAEAVPLPGRFGVVAVGQPGYYWNFWWFKKIYAIVGEMYNDKGNTIPGLVAVITPDGNMVPLPAICPVKIIGVVIDVPWLGMRRLMFPEVIDLPEGIKKVGVLLSTYRTIPWLANATSVKVFMIARKVIRLDLQGNTGESSYIVIFTGARPAKVYADTPKGRKILKYDPNLSKPYTWRWNSVLRAVECRVVFHSPVSLVVEMMPHVNIVGYRVENGKLYLDVFSDSEANVTIWVTGYPAPYLVTLREGRQTILLPAPKMGGSVSIMCDGTVLASTVIVAKKAEVAAVTEAREVNLIPVTLAGLFCVIFGAALIRQRRYGI